MLVYQRVTVKMCQLSGLIQLHLTDPTDPADWASCLPIPGPVIFVKLPQVVP